MTRPRSTAISRSGTRTSTRTLESVLRRVCELIELGYDPAMLTERAEERLQEMAGALPARKGRPEREAGERVDAHALTTKPPTPSGSRSGSGDE